MVVKKAATFTVEDLAKMGSAKTITHLKAGDLSHFKQFHWDALEIDPNWNERDRNSQAYKNHIDWLEESIELNGVRDPLKGYVNSETGKIRVFSGHCRHEALGRLWERGIKVLIPVDVNKDYEKISDAERILSMLVDNTGLELDKLEQARAVRRLSMHGWDAATIGSQLKPKQTWQQVESLLNLAISSKRTQELVRSEDVKFTTVANLVRANGADATDKLITSSVELAKNLGVPATAKFVQGVQELFINEEITPEQVFSNDPIIKEQVLAKTKAKTKGKKKVSIEDVLDNKIDPDALIEGVSTERRKQRKKAFEKQSSAGLMLIKSMRAIAEKAPIEIVGNKIKVTFEPDDWESLKRLFESDFDENINETNLDESDNSENNGKLPILKMFEEENKTEDDPEEDLSQAEAIEEEDEIEENSEVELTSLHYEEDKTEEEPEEEFLDDSDVLDAELETAEIA